ncbi:MAG: helix-turn-helix domain-containing protein [Clostridia bacterium]|nr:helix-turn-helix domain-containing protein [Clostridia bacterium]
MNLKIAEKFQAHRKAHGYSQEELADLLNVSRQAVSKWERGEASPDTDNLIALAKIYNITIDQLINGESEVEVVVEDKDEGKAQETAKNEGEAENVEVIQEEDDDEDDEKKLSAGQRATLAIVGGSASLIITMIYLIVGFCFDLWYPTWILFMLIPVVATFADAIVKKDVKHFAYPVLVAAIYVLIGFLTGLWHPCWAIFLTIPVYYIIIDAVNKCKIDVKAEKEKVIKK